MKTTGCLLFTLFLATLPGACGSEAGQPPQPESEGGAKASTNVDPEMARSLYISLCYTCHGEKGHGDGPGSAACDPKPRTFSDATWQDSVTDDQIKKTIVYGGIAAGKSAVMPAQPQLKGKDAVLNGLVDIVRGFRAN